MKADVAVVIPAYNEAARLDDAPFLDFLARNERSMLTFVNDGSTDLTRVRLESLQAAAPPGRVDVVHCAHNRGKAEAVRAGLRHAIATGAELVGFADADLSAPLDEMTALRIELDRHPEAWAAIGSRVKLLGRTIERSEMRHYLGRIFATCASITLGLPVYDTQCGLKLFRNNAAISAAVERAFISRWIFDVELIGRIASHAGSDAATRIREVPLEIWREKGSSRLGPGAFLRAPLELLRIRRENSRR